MAYDSHANQGVPDGYRQRLSTFAGRISTIASECPVVCISIIRLPGRLMKSGLTSGLCWAAVPVRSWAKCLPMLFVVVSMAAAQETKALPDEECSYTLPGRDWEWLDPNLAPNGLRTVLPAKSSSGLGIRVGVQPVTADWKPTPRTYESFEAGMLKSTSLIKTGAKRLTFKDVPSYQIDAALPGGEGTSTRIFFANDKLYCLQVSNSFGPLSEGDAETLFQGFNFVGTPRPIPIPEDTDDAFELGRRASPGLTIVIGVAVLCIYLWKQNRRSRTA